MAKFNASISIPDRVPISSSIPIILLAAAFFASGITPPGVCGEVIRHNQQEDIDASPFFYGDVENMLEIIESAEQMHANAGLKRETDD